MVSGVFNDSIALHSPYKSQLIHIHLLKTHFTNIITTVLPYRFSIEAVPLYSFLRKTYTVRLNWEFHTRGPFTSVNGAFFLLNTPELCKNRREYVSPPFPGRRLRGGLTLHDIFFVFLRPSCLLLGL